MADDTFASDYGVDRVPSARSVRFERDRFIVTISDQRNIGASRITKLASDKRTIGIPWNGPSSRLIADVPQAFAQSAIKQAQETSLRPAVGS